MNAEQTHQTSCIKKLSSSRSNWSLQTNGSWK